jgi:hypothetical protein
VELGIGVPGDELRQSGLARAGWPVKESAGEAVGGQHASQQPPFADEMVLPDEIFEGAGSHADGERLHPAKLLRALFLEEIHTAGSALDRQGHYTLPESIRMRMVR